MVLNLEIMSNIELFHSYGAVFNKNSDLDVGNDESASHIVLVYQIIEY